MEQARIVHRDLACRNILMMGDRKRVKISDFGLSRDVRRNGVYIQDDAMRLQIKWLAIESIQSRVFSAKSDV